MSIELVYLISTLAAFSIYGVLNGVELGVAMVRVEPRLAPERPSNRVFTPRLEITNLFLVAGCLGMTLFFNEATEAVVRAMWPVLIIGVLALVARAGLLTYLFFSRSEPGGKAPNYLFAIVSLVVPLCLGAAGIYMVTGLPFWQTMVGVTLFLSLLLGLLALSIVFIYYIGGPKAPQGVVLVSRLLNLALAGMLAIVLLGVLRGGDSHLFNLPYAYLAIIASSLVLMQSIFVGANKEWRMWWFLAVIALLAPFLMGLANYPYLIFPEVMI